MKSRTQVNARHYEKCKLTQQNVLLRLPKEQARLLKDIAIKNELSVNAFTQMYLLPFAQILEERGGAIATECAQSGKSPVTLLECALNAYLNKKPETPPLEVANEFESLFGAPCSP